MAESSFAVVNTAGKQYTVKAGSRITVDRVEAEVGSSITLKDVLVTGSEGGAENSAAIKVGTPFVAGASVSAKVLSHDRGPKVDIYKKIRRTGYEKRQGHRQEISHLLVESVTL